MHPIVIIAPRRRSYNRVAMQVHPLIFSPLFKPKVWGGRRLKPLLGKRLPPNEIIGESWEVADLPSGQTSVAGGPTRGRTLGQLVNEWGRDLLGRAGLVDGRFPLAIKFLDAREPLSIQVHPGPRALARADAARGLKHEAWHILQADPDAVIYHGLKRGVSRETLSAAAGTRDVVGLVNSVRVKAGQTLYCPGGTVHALGGGIVAAEVQTASDITYRLYDWERQRPAGDAGMHVRESLDAIEWSPPASDATQRTHVGGLFTTVTRLVRCDAFQVEKVRMVEGMELDIPYAELVIWIVLDGDGEVQYESGPALAFRRGDVVLLPAALRGGRVFARSSCVWLEVTIPTPSDLAGLDHPSAAELRQAEPAGNRPMSLGLDASLKQRTRD